MKRLAVLIAGIGLVAAGCDSNLPEPSPGTTTSTFTFTVPLTAANEVPPITNADAGASGTAVIVLKATRDSAGAITSATMDFQISVTGFGPGTTVTDAHIHNGAAGVNAGIFVGTTLAAGDLPLTNGAGSATKNGINVPADRAVAILNNPAGHYFNVHTALNAAGAIRGQLTTPVQ